MPERPSTPDEVAERHGARVERRRIGADPALQAPTADVEPREAGEPRPAPNRAAAAAARTAVHDQTSDAIRRPAQLSERCTGCGAATAGRTGMVTELVEVGSVRALRVVACSACPPKQWRAVGA